MSKTMYLTKEAMEKLRLEKEDIEKNQIPRIADAIARAKELGDLKENFEYHEAKQQMGFAQGRVQEIDHQLLNAVIYEKNASSDIVALGSEIKVKTGDKEKVFSIVGATEADPLQGFISNESPLGSAFLGRHVGDEIEVETPGGKKTYTVLEVR